MEEKIIKNEQRSMLDKKDSIALDIEICAARNIEDLAQTLKQLDDSLNEYAKRNANAAIHISISMKFY